jgi:predicted component of type VI protein secretion system
VLVNERAISRSVRNLVETITTERFFNSLIGTELRDSLFENFTPLTVTVLEDQIRATIANYEPRVDNVSIEVIGLPDQNDLEVKVLFDIVGLDLPIQSFSFILEPTR